MSANLWKTSTSNAFSTSLDGNITNSDVSITLTSVSGLQYPGILVIDRIDNTNTSTPTVREYISYTGISTRTLTGVTRGVAGSTAQAHSSGAVVEEVFTVTHWGDLRDALLNVLDSAGALDTTKVADATSAQTLTNKILGSGTSFSADPSLDTGVNIKVNSADPKRAFYVPASAMFPRTTTGCAALTQAETTTNKVNYKVLDFDQSTEEYAQFGIPSPKYWDAGTVTATFYWTAASGSGDVIWGLQGMSFANDDALDQAFGTAQTVTDTLLTAGDVHVTSATSAITIGGTPTAGDWIHFQVYRDADAGGDTLSADARLIGVRIEFTLAQYNDA